MAKVTAKQKVIEAAQQLMVTGGYSATTVDDIVNTAGVAKGSFYHAFKSKEELAICALEDYEKKGWDIVTSGPYLQVEDPVERALAFVDYLEDISMDLWQHGCLLGTVSVEVADKYPAVIGRIDELFVEFEEGIAGMLQPALAAKGIESVDAKELAVHLLAIIEGAIITGKSHRDMVHLPASIRHFKKYFELLLDVGK